MITYHIEPDTRKVKRTLNKITKEMPKTNGKMIYRLVQEISRSAKKKYGNVLQKRTGALKKSIKYRKFNNWEAKVYSKWYYAAAHEFGKLILPRKKKYLTFKIDGEWKKMKQVKMPKREFLVPHVKEMFNSGKYKDIMGEVLALELDKK